MRPAWRARRSSLSSRRWPKRRSASSSPMRSSLIGMERSVPQPCGPGLRPPVARSLITNPPLPRKPSAIKAKSLYTTVAYAKGSANLSLLFALEGLRDLGLECFRASAASGSGGLGASAIVPAQGLAITDGEDGRAVSVADAASAASPGPRGGAPGRLSRRENELAGMPAMAGATLPPAPELPIVSCACSRDGRRGPFGGGCRYGNGCSGTGSRTPRADIRRGDGFFFRPNQRPMTANIAQSSLVEPQVFPHGRGRAKFVALWSNRLSVGRKPSSHGCNPLAFLCLGKTQENSPNQ
ncbi:UNVERIFIED_ORG: hypothetical protein M2438_001558 [Methylobacterium sp. SuP10 SLI 274]|nr:hypothetical protein [Methylorubrum extorquens]MDF9791068.1 hypothetical protein [Methylorubrum extorquens]MDF9862772.1 hypothetical protein [Methylorubrum pseudosasae]MDH6636383.1 hypothetical protein [Methylobacterium sp. SuP10 SLI 274]MDH6665561.1 hypothetical protein [Methylorubrum zatmanii]